MGERFKKKDLGKLAVVKWDDASGYTMEEMDSVGLAPCTTVGWVVQVEKNYVVLASSVYDGESYGDYTCLPFGMLTSVSVQPELALASLPSAKQPSQKCSPKASPHCRRCGESCEAGCRA